MSEYCKNCKDMADRLTIAEETLRTIMEAVYKPDTEWGDWDEGYLGGINAQATIASEGLKRMEGVK